MINKFKFFVQGLKKFNEIGTVTRSSPAMCRKIASLIPQNSDYVVELGAGDGVITPYILERLSPQGSLLSFEINPTLYKSLESVADPRLIAVNASAESVLDKMQSHDFPKVDALVSALPYLVMPPAVMDDILDKSKRAMKKDANYLQVHYGKGLVDKYQEVFGNLVIHKILLNVPPAYVFQSVK